MTIDHFAKRVAHFHRSEGFCAFAPVGEHGVAGRDVDHLHFRCAQRQGHCVNERRIHNAHTARQFDDLGAAQRMNARLMIANARRPISLAGFQRDPDRRRVERALQRIHHRHAPG